MIYILHVHLSGNLEASKADIRITQRVKDALEIVDITLLDHLIMNKDEEYSTIDV